MTKGIVGPATGPLIAFTGDAAQELWRFDVAGSANVSGVAIDDGGRLLES